MSRSLQVKMQLAVLALAFGVLIVGLAGVTFFKSIGDAKTKNADLIQEFKSASGYIPHEDIPVAESEEMKRAVREMLNYDDAVYRKFFLKDHVLYIYISYWRPGKFHPRLVSIHTPDVCWTANGLNIVKANNRYHLYLGAFRSSPGCFREFVGGAGSHFVVYWHIVGGELSRYVHSLQKQSNAAADGILTDLFSPVGEQFFIRVSSDSPLDFLEQDPQASSILCFLSPILRVQSSDVYQ